MSELLTFKRFVELESRVRKIEKHLHLDESRIAPVPAESAITQPIVEPPAEAPTAVEPLSLPIDEKPIEMAAVVATPAVVEPIVPPNLPPPLPVLPVEEELMAGEQLFVTPQQVSHADKRPWAAPSPVAYERAKIVTPRKDEHSSVEQWIGRNWTC